MRRKSVGTADRAIFSRPGSTRSSTWATRWRSWPRQLIGGSWRNGSARVYLDKSGRRCRQGSWRDCRSPSTRTICLENPYFQLFCREEFFIHTLPFDRSSLTRWRQRMGEEKLVTLIQESLNAAPRTGAAKPWTSRRLSSTPPCSGRRWRFPPTPSSCIGRASGWCGSPGSTAFRHAGWPPLPPASRVNQKSADSGIPFRVGLRAGALLTAATPQRAAHFRPEPKPSIPTDERQRNISAARL
jgi:hypothetical protein